LGLLKRAGPKLQAGGIVLANSWAKFLGKHLGFERGKYLVLKEGNTFFF
jgi:hypothetical protein